MRLLFDQNLSFKLCRRLSDIFPESSQVRLLGMERADDRSVWEYARANGFALVSLDADFADLAVILGPPPKVIWLRRGNQTVEIIEKMLRDHAEVIAAFDSDDTACLEIY